jgi:hypothetical protein
MVKGCFGWSESHEHFMNGPPGPNALDWDQVKGVAQEAFDVWLHGGELHWAQEVWTKTVAAGMANY